MRITSKTTTLTTITTTTKNNINSNLEAINLHKPPNILITSIFQCAYEIAPGLNYVPPHDHHTGYIMYLCMWFYVSVSLSLFLFQHSFNFNSALNSARTFHSLSAPSHSQTLQQSIDQGWNTQRATQNSPHIPGTNETLHPLAARL